ncbi:MAG TPA: tRNA glutamyl-Q(34) synthetase GluQRS [Humisphaera sp.]|jgi:glutamyl-tRNA synthetase|nr:tRNA glutamyl-Q(34) synthetase GluQRS [Humisphaera sp.]
MPLTRLAPSPTGALHLGNARTFIVNWLLARQNQWEILLRIEDLDGPRIKRNADRQAIEDLRWLGLTWDHGPVYQSARMQRYEAAIKSLLKTAKAYPCVCSRKEVELAASAPHAEDAAPIYPGTCRGKFATMQDAIAQTGKTPAIRFAALDRRIEFNDGFAGPQSFNVARELGDFVIAKADGTAAYQLSVVVDDAEAGVTDIVRGDDLLDSTPRQILLYEALGLADRIPRYSHLPLVIGTDGRRLAKRHGDTRLSFYREQGVPPQRILALIARWCGINAGDSIDLPELLKTFRLDALSHQPIVFTEADDAWLRGG